MRPSAAAKPHAAAAAVTVTNRWSPAKAEGAPLRNTLARLQAASQQGLLQTGGAVTPCSPREDGRSRPACHWAQSLGCPRRAVGRYTVDQRRPSHADLKRDPALVVGLLCGTPAKPAALPAVSEGLLERQSRWTEEGEGTTSEQAFSFPKPVIYFQNKLEEIPPSEILQ